MENNLEVLQVAETGPSETTLENVEKKGSQLIKEIPAPHVYCGTIQVDKMRESQSVYLQMER